MLNFYMQISQAKKYPPCAKLSTHLDYAELIEIYNFFLLGADPADLQNLSEKEQKRIAKTSEQVLPQNLQLMKIISQKIAALNAHNTSLHLPKEWTGLKRSLEVIYCPHNHYIMLNVLTNNKLKWHSKAKPNKTKLRVLEGSSKTGRAGAWQLVPIQKPLFKLVINKEHLFKTAYEEAELSQRLNSKYICKVYAGEEYVKNGIKKLCLYSDYAEEGDLFDFIVTNHPYKNGFENKIDEFILQILLGIKILHDNDLKHGDIKADNILVCNDQYGPYCALTDLGSVSTHQKSQLSGSKNHWSIEMCYFFSKTRNLNYQRFKQVYLSTSSAEIFGKAKLKQLEKRGFDISKLFGDHQNYALARKSYDVWAFGVTLFELLYRRPPVLKDRKIINKNPVLKAALTINPKKRATVDELIKIHLRTAKINVPETLDRITKTTLLMKYLQPVNEHKLISLSSLEQQFSVMGLGAYQSKQSNSNSFNAKKSITSFNRRLTMPYHTANLIKKSIKVS